MIKYKIKNKILKGLIGNSANISENLEIKGFTYGKGLGSIILTYLVKSAFNIHRFPLWEDRHFTNELHTFEQGKDKLKEVFLNENFTNQIDEIIEEIKEIYSFTQNYLNDQYINQDTIKLYRNLGGKYASVLYQLKNKAIEENEKIVKIGGEILNSFTDNFGIYGMAVHIELDIPKKDILYYADIFDYGIMESEEFIVLNQSKNGLIEIPTDKIFKSFDSYNEYEWNLKNYTNSPYYYCNFSLNTEVEFGKYHYKRKDTSKENFICNFMKKRNKCYEL